MLGMSFLYFFLMVTVVLIVYAAISYAWPDSLPGRVAAIVRG
jgi:hypothetical protein